MKENLKEFERMKRLAEIEERNRRIEGIKLQKLKIYEERRKMNRTLENEKEYLLTRFNELMSQKGKQRKSNPDAYQKFHNSFNTNEIKKEIQPLFFQSKKMLLIGTNKEVVVINPKDASRKKSILILKTNKEEGLLPDMTKNFLFIELSKKTLNEMYILCNDIFFPLLTQNVQQPDTSELISKELMEKFHNFLSHFYVALGHTEGKTRLPEPSDEIFRNPNINDNEKTQICEGAIVMWIDLIRYILKLGNVG